MRGMASEHHATFIVGKSPTRGKLVVENFDEFSPATGTTQEESLKTIGLRCDTRPDRIGKGLNADDIQRPPAPSRG
jgi:hypothetical protein